MANASFAILLCRGRWQLAVADQTSVELRDLPAEAAGIGDEAAGTFFSEMSRHGYGGEGIALGIPSEWVLAATISAENLPRSHRRQALLYRLEEQLPLSAEELVADFLERGRAAVGVALETDRLRESVYELESAGIAVQVICPVALLALQELIRGQRHDYAVLALDGHVELAGFQAGHLRSWETVQSHPAAVTRAIRARLLLDGSRDAPAQLLSAGLDERLRGELAQIVDIEVEESPSTSAVESAAKAAAGILVGRSHAWFNLRRDQLSPRDRLSPVRRALSVCTGLCVVFLAALVGGMLWRAGRYRGVGEQVRVDQAGIYQRLYPGQVVPTSVRRRLEGRAQRLTGLRGSSSEMPEQRSALEGLREIVSHLPGNIRLRILELRIEPAGFVIKGQTRSHADPERIAVELRKGGLIRVDAPRTERLARGGVAFTLTGGPLSPGGKEASP